MQLTYSNVTATLALFIALGGTSYAVTKLPRNSVGTLQVRDGSLLRKDLSGSLARGARGPEGPAGPRGPSTLRIAPAADGVRLAGAPAVQTQVRRMDAVPAGAWELRFFGSPQLVGPIGLHTTCQIKVNGDVKATGATVVGDSANATQEAGLLVETAIVLPSPSNVTVDCSQNIASDPAVVVNRPQIIATQVGEIVVTP